MKSEDPAPFVSRNPAAQDALTKDGRRLRALHLLFRTPDVRLIVRDYAPQGTADRVVPIISASVSWLTFVMMGSGLPLLAEIRQQEKSPRQTFFARVEQLIDQIFFDTVACE
jgi:hypothetical protein